MRKLFLLLALVSLSAFRTSAQTVINGNQTYVPGGSVSVQVPNAASTGTTQYKIAKLTGVGTAIISATTDTAGFVGIVKYGAGTSGNASIVQMGQTPCVFDGGITQNDYVINSATVNGDCHDGGATPPAAVSLGRIVSATNASAGTYQVMASVVGSGGINGSLTSGQLAFATAGNVISGDPQLIWDNTNKRLQAGDTSGFDTLTTALVNSQCASFTPACFTVLQGTGGTARSEGISAIIQGNAVPGNIPEAGIFATECNSSTQASCIGIEGDMYLNIPAGTTFNDVDSSIRGYFQNQSVATGNLAYGTTFLSTLTNQNSAGSITDFSAFLFEPAAASSLYGSVTNLDGLHVRNPLDASAVTNLKGVWIEPLSGAINNYAIRIDDQTSGASNWGIHEPGVNTKNLFPNVQIANTLTFNGSSSGSASISTAAAAGTPNPILLPTTTGSSGQALITDGGNPQQLSWSSVATISSAVTGHCVVFSSATAIADSGVSGCTGGGGGGTVTSMSSGNLSPLFTTAVGTPTVTPALSFTLSNAAAHTFFMNNTGGSAAPGFQTAGEADLPAATVFTDQNATFGAHTYDFSGATIFKVKTGAGYAPTVDGQCGVNTTTHLFVCGFNSASTVTMPTTLAAVSHDFLTSYTQTTGAFTQAQPTLADIAAGSAPAGLFDFSTGTFKIPVSAAGTVTANGNVALGTTNGNVNIWANGQSNFIGITPSTVTPVNADCANWTVAASNFTLNDSTYKCVKNFSDLNTFSNGVNAQVGAGYTILLSDGAKNVTLSNAGAQTFTLPASVPATGWWVDVENVGAGTWTSNRNAHNIDNAATNFSLTTNQGVRIYSDGSNYWTQRGVGGAGGGSGTVTSVALAAPTGFTVSGSPVTTAGTLTFAMPSGWVNGDILYGNGANSVARLSGTTTTTPNVYTSTGTGAAANAPALTPSVGGGANPVFATVSSPAQGDTICYNGSVVAINCQAGIVPNAQSGTAYTILSSDRGKFLTFTNAAAVAVTLPQANTAGFANNYVVTIRNFGPGAATITPTISTINNNATLILLEGMQANIVSDNSNYLATVSGYASATTGSISGAITGPGCDSGTVTVNGAATGMDTHATPTTYPGDGIFWNAYVSSANTITVKVCSDVNLTPTASVYNISVSPKLN